MIYNFGSNILIRCISNDRLSSWTIVRNSGLDLIDLESIEPSIFSQKYWIISYNFSQHANKLVYISELKIHDLSANVNTSYECKNVLNNSIAIEILSGKFEFVWFKKNKKNYYIFLRLYYGSSKCLGSFT